MARVWVLLGAVNVAVGLALSAAAGHKIGLALLLAEGRYGL